MDHTTGPSTPPCHENHDAAPSAAPGGGWKRLAAWGVILAVIAGAVAFFRNAGSAEALWAASNGGTWLPPLVAVAALVDSVNPCAFSILLLTIGFLMSMGKSRRGILATGGVYILGVFVVYVLIGLGIVQALHLFNTPHFMAKAGAGLLIVLGALNIAGEIFPNFPIRLRIPHSAHRRMAALMEQASLPTAFLLGAFVGLCEFPCTGGPYLLVLGLLHDASTYWSGLGYLALYNAIFILPLALILFLASDTAVLAKANEWKATHAGGMRHWGSLAMIALGLAMFAFF